MNKFMDNQFVKHILKNTNSLFQEVFKGSCFIPFVNKYDGYVIFFIPKSVFHI